MSSTPTPVQTSWVSLGPEGFDGYLALPPAGQGPGIVLWQEIFGVNAHIRAVAEQYALAGYVVLAPDLFWRSQRRLELGYAPEDMTAGRGHAMQLKPETLQADVQAAAATLRALPATTGTRCGSVGYCLGGRMAYLSAAWAGVDAAVAYYGGGIHDQLALAGQVTGRVQFHYAEHDDHIPLDAVERVRQAIGDRGEVFVYPGARHGFNCWVRGSYHPPSAALALGRSLSFLAEQLF